MSVDFTAINARLESAGAETIVRWAAREFSPDLALSCSFGGGSGMVLVDVVARLGIEAEVFYLDTGLLFPETYALIEEVERRYGIHPVAYRSALTLDEQAAKHGSQLWTTDPDRCCYLRKVAPNEQALKGKKAWMSGIRRDQTTNRQSVPIVEWDGTFELVKISPLAAWTETQVWDYLREHDVPYNPLADQGYASIGCIPCTRPIMPGENARAGRWSSFEKTECGLHLPEAAAASK